MGVYIRRPTQGLTTIAFIILKKTLTPQKGSSSNIEFQGSVATDSPLCFLQKQNRKSGQKW